MKSSRPCPPLPLIPKSCASEGTSFWLFILYNFLLFQTLTLSLRSVDGIALLCLLLLICPQGNVSPSWCPPELYHSVQLRLSLMFLFIITLHVFSLLCQTVFHEYFLIFMLCFPGRLARLCCYSFLCFCHCLSPAVMQMSYTVLPVYFCTAHAIG